MGLGPCITPAVPAALLDRLHSPVKIWEALRQAGKERLIIWIYDFHGLRLRDSLSSLPFLAHIWPRTTCRQKREPCSFGSSQGLADPIDMPFFHHLVPEQMVGQIIEMPIDQFTHGLQGKSGQFLIRVSDRLFATDIAYGKWQKRIVRLRDLKIVEVVELTDE